MANPVYLAAAAIVVQLLFFASIFDIYFTSPVDHGMIPQSYTLEPPAKRLVLFVADGLRADTIFSPDRDGSFSAPYLRRIMEFTGRWGVSHTHVPTESRPGHVALIAGLYEDVSAVARGWTENPVEFDSVFNESRHTWSWGSPDILPMFSKGAVPGRVETFMYDAAWEDFADSDASKLDTWVFEKVEDLFNRARSDQHLAKLLSEERIVFFLHLLGIDTNGHSHKPMSREVMENLKLVDKGVEKVVQLIDSYYGDDKTAYVFTSDHGMTDWGSHGAGLADETMTPLICWGAGVKGPRPSSHAEFVHHDGYTEKWGMNRFERVDVEQADIAPLMATLIGAPVPLNSEGTLPLAYIHYNQGFIAHSIFANARQLAEQLRIKEERIKTCSLPFTFRPFLKLTGVQVTERRQKIDEMIRSKSYQHAIDLSRQLIDLSKEGVRYYHTYHRFSLKVVLALGFCGWMVCILIAILEDSTRPLQKHIGEKTAQPFPIKTAVLCVIIWVLLWYQSSPLLYYLYYSVPIFCWSLVWHQRGVVLRARQLAVRNPVKLFKGVAVSFFITCGLELHVLSFFFREVLSILLLLVSLWPYVTELVHKSLKLCVSWSITCLLLAVFPLLPVIGRNANFLFVFLSGAAAVGIVAALLSKPQIRYILTTPNSTAISPFLLLKVRVALLVCAAVIPGLANSYFSQKESIPIVIHAFSWCTLFFSVISPFFGTLSLPGRLMHIALALYTIFLLLSTTFEAIFMLLLCFALFLWLKVEETLACKQSQSTTLWESVLSFRSPKVVTLMPNESRASGQTASFEDARRVVFCIFFAIVSFYGTGNIASVNSFDPTTVYCFLTVFSPFVMGGLVIWKMVLPFIFITCVYNSILSLLNRSLRVNLLLTLLMSNAMGLNFFFLVRDSGSWLEIGISISHYVIMMVMATAMVVLIGVARLLTGVAVVPRKIEDHLF